MSDVAYFMPVITDRAITHRLATLYFYDHHHFVARILHGKNGPLKALTKMENPPITAVDSSAFTELNLIPLQTFTARLADIFEHSPWVPQRVAHLRPFRDAGQLHHAMVSAVAQASPAEQLALLRAHPELAGKEAQQGELTAASDGEQARAGLKALNPAEMQRITALNAAYLARHGFPFIVCVGQHTKQSLFLEFDRRLGNPREIELREALDQVAEIAALRLNALFSA